MTSFYIHNTIQIGIYLVALLATIVYFNWIDTKPVYFAFLRATFKIRKVSNDEKNVVLDIYGRKMSYSEHRKLRIFLKILVVISLHIISVVFVDGCILSTIALVPTSSCPSSPATTCFHSDRDSKFNAQEFYCPPDQPISTTNITVGLVICYTLMIRSQSIASILGELGVCTSILTLLGLTFKALYLLAYWKIWGTLLTIGLGLTLITGLVLFCVLLPTFISFLAFVLAVATVVLLINAVLLVHLVRRLGQATTSHDEHTEPWGDILFTNRSARKITMNIDSLFYCVVNSF